MALVDQQVARQFRGGYLNIDKSPGWTSTDVVRKLKGLTHVSKIGHGGTLDPIASGVLAICLGSATRFAENFLLGDKDYRLTIVLGDETDTYDSEGTVTGTAEYDHVTLDMIEKVVSSRIGPMDQVPPMYSAVRHKGRRLYELARQGIEVEREPRAVELYGASVVSFEPPTIVVDIRCSHGFYARTFAHEIGRGLDSAAHLTGLVRTRSGKLKLEDAHSIAEMEKLALDGRWEEATLPIDFTLEHLRRVDLDPLKAEMVRHGQLIGVAELPTIHGQPDERIRVYEDGELIAVLRFLSERATWQPEKVLS